MARQYDQYGNYTDNDGQYWVGGPGTPQAGQYYYGGTWNSAPPGGRVGGIDFGGDSGTDRTYQEEHLYGGPDGPGWYLVDPVTRAPIRLIKADTPSGGGGGASRDTYVQRTVPAGGDSSGLPPGTVYQINTTTNAISIIDRPSATTSTEYDIDRDQDGYDDKTGLPFGARVIGGKIYINGVQINPDGSRYVPEPEENNAKTWTGQGPKGYGTYYLDGPGGTPGTFIGDTRAPSSSSASAGATFTGSGKSIPSGSGGGGGSTRDYAAEQAANDERQAQMAADARKWQSEENEKNRAQQAAQFAATYGLSVAQFTAQQEESRANRRRALINDFSSAVSDTDMAKLQARRLAASPTGDVTNAELMRDNPGGFRSNDAAAALLAEIRGIGSAPPPGVPMLPGGAPAGAPPVGPAGPTNGTGPGAAPVTPPPMTQQQGIAQQTQLVEQQQNQAMDAERAKYLADNARGNWTLVPSVMGMDQYRNTVTGETMPVGQWAQFMNEITAASGGQSATDQLYGSMSAQERAWFDPNTAKPLGVYGGNWTSHGMDLRATSSGGRDTGERLRDFGSQLYDMPWGPSLTNQMPSMPAGYLDPRLFNPDGTSKGIDPKTFGYPPDTTAKPSTSLPYGDDHIIRDTQEYPIGSKVPDMSGGQSFVYDPATRSWRPNLPMMARGGVARGSAIVGERGPEIIHHTPRGTVVQPMAPRAAEMLMRRGMPGMKTGGLVAPLETGFKPIAQPQPIVQPVTQPMAPLPTQPVSTQAPMTPLPAKTTTTEPTGVAAFGPAGQPAQTTQPVTQPTGTAAFGPAGQPAQTTPTTAGGSTVPTTPVFDPANPTALTPEATAFLDEIDKFRNNLVFPELNTLDDSFLRLAPTIQDSTLKGYKTKYGLPIEDQLFEMRKFALAGRPTMGPLGY